MRSPLLLVSRSRQINSRLCHLVRFMKVSFVAFLIVADDLIS